MSKLKTILYPTEGKILLYLSLTIIGGYLYFAIFEQASSGAINPAGLWQAIAWILFPFASFFKVLGMEFSVAISATAIILTGMFYYFIIGLLLSARPTGSIRTPTYVISSQRFGAVFVCATLLKPLKELGG